MIGLPIYRDGDTLFFPGGPDELAAGVQALAAAYGLLKFDYAPATTAVLKRVAELGVRAVDDPSPYIIELVDIDEESVSKPHIGRAPDIEAGKTVVQSLIFDREKFTPEQARTWIAEHNEFGDYGLDETETSYRFRQYDPENFSRFRTRQFDDGVVAVIGVVKDDGLELHVLHSEVRKAADGEAEERFVLSLVLEPNDGTEGAPFAPDTQGDIYSAEEIRRTAHGWLEKGGKIDIGHNWRALGKSKVCVVESYIAPVDFTLGEYEVRKGSWLLGLRVLDDDLWTDIKSGKIGAYSVGGTAVRKPVEAP